MASRGPVQLPSTGDPLPGWKGPKPLIIAGVAAIIIMIIVMRERIPRYDIFPGDVTVTATGVQGSFEMTEVGPFGRLFGEGIVSTGSGGACLVFPAAQLGFTEMAKTICHSNTECSHPNDDPNAVAPDTYIWAPNSADPNHKENRYGYCDRSTNQCWAKPIRIEDHVGQLTPADQWNDKVCNRPTTLVPSIPQNAPKNGPIDVSPLKLPKNAQVRVVACLNEGSPPYAKPPCGQPDDEHRIEKMGKPAPVSP